MPQTKGNKVFSVTATRPRTTTTPEIFYLLKLASDLLSTGLCVSVCWWGARTLSITGSVLRDDRRVRGSRRPRSLSAGESGVITWGAISAGYCVIVKAWCWIWSDSLVLMSQRAVGSLWVFGRLSRSSTSCFRSSYLLLKSCRSRRTHTSPVGTSWSRRRRVTDPLFSNSFFMVATGTSVRPRKSTRQETEKSKRQIGVGTRDVEKQLVSGPIQQEAAGGRGSRNRPSGENWFLS